MPKRKYALRQDGEKTLEISWSALWKNVEVRLNGNLIGTIPTRKELEAGQTFQLPDGTSLKVQLVRNIYSADIQLLRDNKPVPGSSSDPAAKLAQSYGIMYFIAGLNIILGVAAMVFQVELLETLGFGVISLAIGLVFLVLGFFTQRRSLVALIIALVLYGLDSILLLFSGFNTSIVVRILFLFLMWQGVGAINQLKKES